MELDATDFAQRWVATWNRLDIDGVLRWFAEDVVFTSPTACVVVPDSDGVVRGRDALADYWQRAVAGNPYLHFELIGAYLGLDLLVINYRNQEGALRNEVLRFASGLVVEGHGTHWL